jgi:tetratricopeptide (TPR) repeat protein
MHRTFWRFFLIIALSCPIHGHAAEKVEAEAPSTNMTSDAAKENVRAYLQLQDQLHSALLAIEQARKEAETNSRRNSEAIEQARQEADASERRSAELVGARLRVIEQTLTNQHDRTADAMQKSNRFMIILAAVFGGVGLLGMLFTAFCLWRALTRVAQITASLQPLHAMHLRQMTSGLGGPDGPFVTLNGPEMSSTRLLGAIDRLEKRIRDLENTSGVPNGPVKAQIENGEPSTNISSLLERGQAFLNSDEPEKALACFEEALKLAPGNAEALVKKGTALEQLKRPEEAIMCYDRAIAANDAMTVAYLHKGAVFNQLERFSEALECYEQALRTQHKPVNT